jgi:CheY-like chemotaxis protein
MKKILYVEDDQLLSRLYSQKLAEAGFEVVTANDGLVAIRKLAEFTPDLIVLDLLMPRMTGADVLKFMRQHEHMRTIPVIVFSNSFLSDLTQQVVAAKVETALVKSTVTPAKLIETIRNVLTHPAGQLAPMAPGRPVTGKEGFESPESRESETEFQARVQKDFFERTPVILADTRKLCAGFLEAGDPVAERRRVEELARKMGFLSQMTSLAGCHQLALLSSAIEALLVDLHDQPAKLNDSSRQTVVSAIAFLTDQLDVAAKPEKGEPKPAAVLVVDDDAVSNRAVVLALNRAKLEATSATDPFDALKKLEQKPFQLVMLDIDMPGMDGITLCEKMRALPGHRRTPVIFVTGLTDFKTRARSLLSGMSDLITKPILPLELTVKAVTQLMRHPAR